MNISVIGAGYVGLVSGTCFAEIGHHVTCIDIDQNKIKNLKNGIMPIYEQGLEELVKKNAKEERLFFQSDYTSVKDSKAIFLAVGTPSKDDGSANLTYLFSALDSIAPNMANDTVVVIKSTVPVGTHKQVQEYLEQLTDKSFFVVNNPEFLKEGSAVHDFMKTDRIIIGFEGEIPENIMNELYRPFTRKGIPLLKMSNLSAEMTKYAANCYLATRISFINEIAKLCDATGADISEVRFGMGSDKRIGKYFLYPGPGYGGSCFPKDVQALLGTAKSHGLDLEIVQAAERVNAKQKTYMAQRIKKYFKGDLTGKTLTLWGASFKANTDDVRESPAINTATELVNAGATVNFYDPIASENFKREMDQRKIKVNSFPDKYTALKNSDGLITMTEWQEFASPDYSKIKELLNEPVIFDARNILDTEKVLSFGFTYFAVGKKV